MLSQAKLRGFTLIELLIVIAIILILVAIALPNFLEAQIRAKVARVQADLRTIGTAMEMYFHDFDIYPPRSEDEFDASNRGLVQLTTPIPYISEIPFDVFVGGGRPADQPNNQRPVFWEMASTGLKPFLVSRGVRPYRNIHAYVVYSHGPAIVDMFHDEGDWPFSGPANPCTGRLVFTTSYSPTNGTKSLGNIHRLGGAWHSGHWCMDWQIIRGAGWDSFGNPQGIGF